MINDRNFCDRNYVSRVNDRSVNKDMFISCGMQ